MATKKPDLKVEKRKITGRKIKTLRREGILPANIYGKKVKSQSVQLNLKSFLPVYQEVGETGVVNLRLKGETKARPVLIHNVQFDSVTDQPLHADFYQVSLKEKVTAEIPIELVGESPAVKEKIGVLIQPLSEVEVEALPTELPDKFELSVDGLKQIDDAVTVAELKAPKGVKVLTGAKEVLAKIEPPAKEEEVAPPPEAAEGEGAPEGEAPAESEEAPAEGQPEKPAEGKPVESKPVEKGQPTEATKPSQGKPVEKETKGQ